jgi:hypothetical protein
LQEKRKGVALAAKVMRLVGESGDGFGAERYRGDERVEKEEIERG